MGDKVRVSRVAQGVFVGLLAVTLVVVVVDLVHRDAGGVEGSVKHRDEQSNVVLVSSGLLGLSSVPVVITPETRIFVHGKLGGFGDLHRGLFVRVAYDVLGERFMASSVDVLDATSQGTAIVPSASVSDDTRTSMPASDPSAASREQPFAAPADARTAPAEMPQSAQSPPRVAPWTPVSASSLPAQRSAPAPRAASRPTKAAGEAPTPPRPARSAQNSEDGGAAIDWLLKEAPTSR